LPHCSERIDVFSTGGGRRTAADMGVPFLERCRSIRMFASAAIQGTP